jgi:S1-C subfamily serine protease
VDFIVRAETPDDGTVRRMAWEWLGLEAGEDRYGLGVKRVRRAGPAAGIGLRAGDRLLEVEGEEMARGEDFTRILFPALRKGSVLFLIQRNQYGYYVTLKVPEGQ